MGQADPDLLHAYHDCPCTRRQIFIRTARRYRTIEIQAGSRIVIAATLPDDIRHAIETIARAADLRTNLAQLRSHHTGHGCVGLA